MRNVGIGVIGLTLFGSVTTVAQTPPPARFAAAAVTPFADSFVTLLQGVPRGWHRYTLTKSSEGFHFIDAFAISGILARSLTLALTSDLAVTSVSATGEAFGQGIETQLHYEGRRAKGWAVVHGDSEPQRVAIDTTIPEGAFDGHALMALLPLLGWQVGASYSLTIFDTDENSITTQTLHIAAIETITVPAGTFETFRGDLSTTQAPVRLWYTTSQPHRLIKVADSSNTIVDMLVGRASQ